MDSIQSNKELFVSSLKATNREGINRVVSELDKLGFFTAPASARHHLAEEGGLVRHSLNVYGQAIAIAETQINLYPDLRHRLPFHSIAIAALLHDICKAEIYKPEIKHRKLPSGKWEDYKGYTADYSANPLGHGEKSVIMLLKWGLALTDDEIMAIRWHMGGWDLSTSHEANGNFAAACSKSPLLSVLVAADELATRITENDSISAPLNQR